MDYHRIYSDFIKDRRAKEPRLEGYVERHHILPRTLGGGDEPENLINLTAEDHFFAHLVLAKMHGGKLWTPLAFMVGGHRKDYKPIQSRERYGWVKRALSKANSGENAHQFDRTNYTLLHKDGRVWIGTQSGIYTELGVSRSLTNMLVKGRVKTAKGWRRMETPAPKPEDHPMYRSEKIRFIHVDGREFTGTQHDLHLQHGIAKSNACLLVKGRYACVKGWYVEGKPPVAARGKGAKYRVQLEVRARDSLV